MKALHATTLRSLAVAHIAVCVFDSAIGARGALRRLWGQAAALAAALAARVLSVQLCLQLQRKGLVAHLHCSAAQLMLMPLNGLSDQEERHGI